MAKIENYQDGKELKGKVILKFYADWCNPCKNFSPIIEEISKTEFDDTTFLSVDVDKHNNISSKYNISSIPAVVALNNNKEVGKIIGQKSKTEVIKFIKDSFSE